MFFIASKILSFIIQPVVWFIVLLCTSFFSKKAKVKKRFLLISIISLVLFSNTYLFNCVSYVWETKAVNPTLIRDTFEVAVVLGGVASYDEINNLTQFHSNSDRILNILPLYFDGRVKKILLSGGSGKLDQDEVEAEVLAEYLLRIGVAAEDLILEVNSKNTYENALYSAEILHKQFPNQKILLSTSSTHMRRALACFEKQEIDCIAFSVDQTNNYLAFELSDLFIPNTDILNKWYWLMHEFIGHLSYKMRGYC